MSKLRIGQEVTLGDKKFKVTKCDGAYRHCRICQEHNKIIPCFNPDPISQSTTISNVWTKDMCKSQLPNGSYLKPIN